jgi:hypothetical protein
MASLRSAGVLSVALLAATGHTAPFSVFPRDDVCPYIPMSVDDSLYNEWPGHNGTVESRSLWVRTPNGYRATTPVARNLQYSQLDEIPNAIEKRADGKDLWDYLNNGLDEGEDDKPCFQVDHAKWHDFKGSKPSLPYKSLRAIFSELGLPVGEWPEYQDFAHRNYGKNAEDKVYYNMALKYYENGYDPDDDETPASGHFTQQMSVANGVIVAVENDRGLYKDEDGKIKFKVPVNWKDATWYQWQRLAGIEDEDVSNLQYIVRYNVVNEISKKAIQAAFDGDDIYETKTFDSDDDTFYSLLGSPNASGIPKFLVEHQNALGKKTIESISIKATEGDEEEQYMMWIKLTEYDD